MSLIIEKRYPGERRDIREFIQPNSYMVRQIASTLNPHDFPQACWIWVRDHIKYPPGEANLDILDRHYQEVFTQEKLGQIVPMFNQLSIDFWQFPSETLALGMGDCDDAAILLCSLMRCGVSEREAFVTIGYYNNTGHAWVNCRGLIYETTPSGNRKPSSPVQEIPPYYPITRFNDIIVGSAESIKLTTARR